MPLPEFMDMVRFHSDPENYMNPLMSEEELEGKKQGMQDALEQLRHD